MKKNYKISIAIILFITLIVITSTVSLAAFATSIGTVENYGTGTVPITSTGLITTSKNYYLGLRIFTK